MRERHIQLPLDEDTVRSLRTGDTVLLSGQLITARDQATMRLLKARKRDLPISLDEVTIMHAGPLMRQEHGQWTTIALGPTTSARMNATTVKLLDAFPVRAIIGKGGMDVHVHERMVERGSVYLAMPGGCAVVCAKAVKRVEAVHWFDLGMAEALWVLDVEQFGPLTVAMDAHGASLYETVANSVKKRLIKN